MAGANWDTTPWSLPGANTPMQLPSRDTVPALGSLPSGTPPSLGSTGSPGGSFDLGGGGSGNSGNATGGIAGAAAPLLLSLFGSNPYTSKVEAGADALKSSGEHLQGQGRDLSSMGAGALAPVLSYLAKVTGGDPSALLAATLPQRKRVIDQYDTARKNLANTTPRGGGTASIAGELGAHEASDLAATTATARTEGINEAAQLGISLSGQGIYAQNAGGNEIAQSTDIYGQLQRQRAASNAGFGQAIGSFLKLATPLFLGGA